MNRSFIYLFSLALTLSILPSFTQAQVVNFDETWVEFLTNPKTSNISKLTKPDKKTSPEFYLKYCLMYANTYFCADDIRNAVKMMDEIRGMGKEQYAQIPKFNEKFEKLNGDIELI